MSTVKEIMEKYKDDPSTGFIVITNMYEGDDEKIYNALTEATHYIPDNFHFAISTSMLEHDDVREFFCKS